MGIKNVFKWRVTTNKYLYLTDEENQAPFILDKRTGDRTYPEPISGSTVTGTTVITGMTLDEGLISQTVSNIKSADSYSEKYDKMVALVPFDNDTSKLTFLEYDKYFNLDGAECVEEAVTPKCEGYEPVFNVSAYTLQNSGETEVEYTFYAERNEADKTLRYNLELGIPRGEKGEKGDDGIGCKGDKGDDGLDAIISNVEADVKTLEPYEEPAVSVISSRTEDNEYDLKFWFKLPSGKEGKQGPVGDDGAAGWDAIVKNVTATASALMPGSTPTVDVTNFHINQNGEEHINETSFNLDFKIPRGEKGSQGDNGLNAEIRTVTAEVIETKEAGYWEHDEESGTDIWVDNDAEAGVVVTPAGGGNVIDLAFWFKIPRGRQGEKGDPGDGGGSDTGGWMYNFFDPQFIPTPGLEIPIGDWDVHYHQALAEADVKLQIYYPEDWGGGGGATCDDDCRKHRYDHYQNNSDSLSEGMVQVINGVVYPLATAQGIRSHAEGIGMELPPYSYIEVKIEGGCTGDYNITIPKNTIPVGVEFDDIVGLQLYLNSDDVVLSVTPEPGPGDNHNYPGIPEGVTEADFCDAIRHAEMTIVDATLVNSEDDHLQYDDVEVEYTLSGVTYHSELGYLVSNHHLYDNKLKLNFVVNPPDAIGVATHTEGRACQAVGDYSHAEGWDTLTRGSYSHAEGLGTYTTNLSEHAEGQYNVSHSEDRTEFNDSNGCSTVSSIGIGDGDRKNAVEVMQNGDVYIYGVGNYDGTEVKCQNSEVETLQDVLNHLRSDADREQEIRGQVIPVILPEYSGDEPPANPSVGEYWHDTDNDLLMIYGYSGTTLVWKTADTSLKFIDEDRDSIYIYNAEDGYWNSEGGNVEYLYLSKNTNDLLMWDDSQNLFVAYNNGETTPSVYFIKVAEVYESMPASAPTSMLHEYVLISDGTDYVLYQGIYDENASTHVVFEEVTDPIYTNAIYFDSNDDATLYLNSDSDFNENKFQPDSTGFLENVYYVNVINGDVYGLNDGVLVLLSVVPLPDTVTLNVNTEHGSRSYKSLTTVITDKLVNYNKPGVYTLNVLNNESGLATVYTLEVTEKNGNHRVQHIHNNDVSYTREQFKNVRSRRGAPLTWGRWSAWNVFFYRDAVNFELRNISKDATTSGGYTYKDSNVAVRIMSQDMEFVRLNEEFITVRLYRKHNKNRINKFRLIHTPITTSGGVRYTPVSIALSKCNRGKNSPIYTLPLTVKNCMDSLISVSGSVVDNGTTVNVTNLNQIMKYGCGNEYTSGVTIYRKGVDKSHGASFAAYGYATGFKYDTEDGIAHPSISITLGINVVLGNGTGNTTHYNASPIEACRYRVSTVTTRDGYIIRYGMTQSFTKNVLRR